MLRVPHEHYWLKEAALLYATKCERNRRRADRQMSELQNQIPSDDRASIGSHTGVDERSNAQQDLFYKNWFGEYFPHGEPIGFKRGCQCSECDAAKDIKKEPIKQVRVIRNTKPKPRVVKRAKEQPSFSDEIIAQLVHKDVDDGDAILKISGLDTQINKSRLDEFTLRLKPKSSGIPFERQPFDPDAARRRAGGAIF